MAHIEPPSHPLRSTALHVGFAFIAMGGWAAFANRDHGGGAMALAFCIQGLLSGLITLGLKRWLEAAHARLPRGVRLIAPPLVSCLVIAGLLALAHRLAGTPEILHTLAVPWSVSTLYAFAYTASLERRA